MDTVIDLHHFDALTFDRSGCPYFEHALDLLQGLGIERDRILHVAQSLFHDHEPAKKLGLCTVWANRRAGRPGRGATRAPRGHVQPDLTVNSPAELAGLHAGQGRRDSP